MNYTLQRKYRSLERRREPKRREPKMPKLPEEVFYRILDGEGTRNKKHVKFQLLGAEDHEKTNILHLDLSPIPARYLKRMPEHSCTRYLCHLDERNAELSVKETRLEIRLHKEALFD